MFSKKADFYGEINLENPEVIPGFGAIIDETEETYLKMMLGARQYSEFLNSIFDKDSENYAKWCAFLFGGFSYEYDNFKIKFQGAIKSLNYFCFLALLNDSTFTAGTDLYKQVVTSGNRLEGLDRENKLNSIHNRGIYYFRKAADYMANNEDFDFDTAYTCFPIKKSAFGGVRL